MKIHGTPIPQEAIGAGLQAMVGTFTTTDVENAIDLRFDTCIAVGDLPTEECEVDQ